MRHAVISGILGLSALACGGNVVVDSSTVGAGGGGSGGASTSSSSSGTASSSGSTSSSGSITCGETSCAVGSDGSCTCDALCAGQDLMVQCAPSGGSNYCKCFQNGLNVANCFDAPGSSCPILTGCCGDAFFGG